MNLPDDYNLRHPDDCSTYICIYVCMYELADLDMMTECTTASSMVVCRRGTSKAGFHIQGLHPISTGAPAPRSRLVSRQWRADAGQRAGPASLSEPANGPSGTTIQFLIPSNRSCHMAPETSVGFQLSNALDATSVRRNFDIGMGTFIAWVHLLYNSLSVL